MDVLQAIDNLSMDHPDRPVDVVVTASALYQPGWIRHPDRDVVLEQLRTQFRWLEAEKLIEAVPPNTAYRLAPAAARTLDEYLIDERRHADSQATQRRLFWVAIAACIAAALQAAAAIWQIWSPSPPAAVVVTVQSTAGGTQSSRDHQIGAADGRR